ncbi:MAG: nitroreductase family protein [Eubacteriales bacterium]|nr:nitroreductase family protein [Eubacteriales bacterium]MDY3332749.1 nitroreductase family protein [Gallibacter sp.]
MDIIKIMEERHSVRAYKSIPIEQEKRDILNQLIAEINSLADLNIQILYDEPTCFDSLKAHYGKFRGVQNYISLIGKKSKGLDEKLGYYGEQIVLKAQELGLNTCWVALTHGKSKAQKMSGESERCLISIGYGETNGVAHKSKEISTVSNYEEGMPEWFLNGVKAALLAPTAVNQQKFYFELDNNDNVAAKHGRSFYAAMDLGIAKYHFELASGKEVYKIK